MVTDKNCIRPKALAVIRRGGERVRGPESVWAGHYRSPSSIAAATREARLLQTGQASAQLKSKRRASVTASPTRRLVPDRSGRNREQRRKGLFCMIRVKRLLPRFSTSRAYAAIRHGGAVSEIGSGVRAAAISRCCSKRRVQNSFQGQHPPSASIGTSVFLDHATGIHRGARRSSSIGDEVTIYQNVNIETKGKRSRRAPRMGRGCLLSSGGDHSRRPPRRLSPR